MATRSLHPPTHIWIHSPDSPGGNTVVIITCKEDPPTTASPIAGGGSRTSGPNFDWDPFDSSPQSPYEFGEETTTDSTEAPFYPNNCMTIGVSRDVKLLKPLLDKRKQPLDTALLEDIFNQIALEKSGDQNSPNLFKKYQIDPSPPYKKEGFYTGNLIENQYWDSKEELDEAVAQDLKKLEERALLQKRLEVVKNESPPKIYHELGLVYSNLGEFKKAFDYFEQGLKLDPNNESLQTSMEKLLTQEGNSDWLFQKLVVNDHHTQWTWSSFYPNLLRIQKGLQIGGCKALWNFSKGSFNFAVCTARFIFQLAERPIDDLAISGFNKSTELAKSFKDLCSKETISLVCEVMKDNIENFKSLPLDKKSEQTALVLGQLLIDAYLLRGTLSTLRFRNLRRNLGTFTASKAEVERSVIEVQKHLKRVETYKKTTSLHKAKQLLHDVAVVDRNTQKPKSIIFLTVEEIEASTVSLMGKGVPMVDWAKFGDINYKEVVKFNKICGEVYMQDLEKWVTTPYAKVHYKQNGLYHIVPYNPEGNAARAWRKLYE